MSVILLDEFKSKTTHQDKQEVMAERTRILNMASQKAQKKTLTLQETTDLYTQFNNTYKSTYSAQSKHKEDESWALKLLEECEKETKKTASFETRINGIPLDKRNKKSTQNLQVVLTDTTASNQSFHSEAFNFEQKKPKLSDSFIYDQFNVHYDDLNSKSYQKSHKAFVSIMAISFCITAAALIGGALFL